ncbi:MAG: tryptophan 2,3-dioxygenase [Actinobacteria bacterium]|nr:tryptophan 2,3-dioxygenase [Actinomycetota bacterium]
MTVADARYYADYLALDRLLDAQHPVSSLDDGPAHDEMLFIIVHQAFELWFKQILWELEAVNATMGADTVPARDLSRAVARLRRVVAIQPLLRGQLEVLETMTPLDFLDFRDALVPASGFQSAQFRVIENRLGVEPTTRLRIKGAPYHARLTDDDRARVLQAEREPSLLEHVDRWLARTPFLRFGDFDFWTAYRGAVNDMLDRERTIIERNPNLDDEARAEELASHDETIDGFAALFDRDRYAQLHARGLRRLSYDAFLAALLITLYRDEPIFHLPFQLLVALVDIDEGFTAWRYRHALLVQRMIGDKVGTGGTSGHVYLQKAAERHRAFGDLFSLPTFCIPRSALPELPEPVRRQLGFRWEHGSGG